MKILTISIAAYNVEKYIRQTLDSLIDKRVIDDLEIFVVDDGGTDKTLEIAKEYAKKYPQSIVPVHKENGGYGTTVNYSIAHATGKYFKLLDGDDWFDSEALCRLVEALRKIDVDVVYCPYKKVYYKNDGAVNKVCIVTLDGYKNGDAILLDNVKKPPGMWGIIYKTETLKKSDMVLPSHTLYTDSVYSAIPQTYCKSAIFLDICLYQYRLGREGQSVGRDSIIRHADDEKKLAKMLCTYYVAHKSCDGINIEIIKRYTAGKYRAGIKTILLAPVCKETLQRLKVYETEIGSLSSEIYEIAEKDGKLGLFLWLCRRTNYLAYWLLKLIPGGYPC